MPNFSAQCIKGVQGMGYLCAFILSLAICVPMSMHQDQFKGRCLLFSTGHWQEQVSVSRYKNQVCVTVKYKCQIKFGSKQIQWGSVYWTPEYWSCMNTKPFSVRYSNGERASEYRAACISVEDPTWAVRM